jgi:hypothetical protein
LPQSSNFTLEYAATYYSSLSFRVLRDGQVVEVPIRAELSSEAGENEPSTFRVFYGDWAISAWLDKGEEVLQFSQYLAEGDDLPAPAAVIASCDRRLSVSSDVDEPGYYNSENFTHYYITLRKQFGAFVYDYVDGGWWE